MIEALLDRVHEVPRFAEYGRVTRVVGLVIEAVGVDVAMGELCELRGLAPDTTVLAEVVGFHERGVFLMPLDEVQGMRPGVAVVPTGSALGLDVGPGLLGRILDGLGDPMDGLGHLGPTVRVPLSASPPNPLNRRPVDEPMATGVRAIDGLLTIGRGQRMGIFAGSGVGKSTLLGMIARYAQADVNVIALLGERGREVQDFVQGSLGPEGLKRSVLVVATGDQAALMRARGAQVATAIAEYFRDQGKQVLLMIDSITRVAMAWREIGLAVGEPPTTKGYPPSVFAALPRLLERAGNSSKGGITGIYTVLVEGDDFNEPVADSVRSILDGQVVLSRRLAASGHFPAIEVTESTSRVRDQLVSVDHRKAADEVAALIDVYRRKEDLISVGAYQPGSDPELDTAVRMHSAIGNYVRQRPDEVTEFEQACSDLRALTEAPPAESH